MQANDTRLWDREPSLSDLAQTATISSRIPPDYPYIMVAPAETGHPEPAVNLSTTKLKIGLWGPPESLTLSIGKTDVWDRRRALETPLTLDEIRRGAFAPVNARYRPSAQINGYLLPAGGVGRHYRAWDAYRFPCPKPVGQIILHVAQMEHAAQPSAVTSCADGSTTVLLRNDAATLEVTYLGMMTRNIIAVRFAGTGLKDAVSLRLYRHQDTVSSRHANRTDYDYEADAAWNGPMAPPQAFVDGRFFGIRQVFPAETTFPDGFEYVMVGLAPDAETALAAVNNDELGLRLYRNRDNPPAWKHGDYDYDADLRAGRNVGPLAPPEVGVSQGLPWLRQRLPAEATFPEGFEVALAAQASGGATSLDRGDGLHGGDGRFPRDTPRAVRRHWRGRAGAERCPRLADVRHPRGPHLRAGLPMSICSARRTADDPHQGVY